MIKLTDIQLLKLGKTIHHIKNSNFFYGQRFDTIRISNYQELTKLPFMDFVTLAHGYPFAFSCADQKSLCSAFPVYKSDEPIMNLQTFSDISHTAEMVARLFSMAEITSEDTLMLISKDCDAPSIISASEKLNHFLIRAGEMDAEEIHQAIADTSTTCLIGASSEIKEFVEECRELALDLEEAGLTKCICIGKPLTNGTRKHIEKLTNTEVYTIFDYDRFLTGMMSECRQHTGLHLWDDHYIAEIIDDDQPVPDGETGELVITTLSLFALPLIRFKTGITAKIVTREKCECGLQTPIVEIIN